MRRTTLILLATLLLLLAVSVAASQDPAEPPATSDPGATQPDPEVDLDLSYLLETGRGGVRILRLMPDAAIGIVPAPLYCPAGARDDRCAAARRIVQSEPCTRADDCRAFQDLQDMLGEPGVELLDVRDGQRALQPIRTAVTEPQPDER